MASDSAGTRVDVDDSDLSRIVYSAGWGESKTTSAYDGTLHYAQDEGLTATFTFTGTLVAVMGSGGDTVHSGFPSVSFLIDGKNYGTRVDSPSITGSYYNITFFTSPNLPAGEHTLVVTNLNGTRPNTFWLDRFWYISSAAANSTSANTTASPLASAGTTPSASGSGSPLATSGLPPPPASGGSGSGASTTSHSQNLGAIIGGSVGGAVTLLLAIALCVYFFRKRRAERLGGSLDAPDDPYGSEAASFVGHRPQFVSAAEPSSAAPTPSFVTNTGIVSSSGPVSESAHTSDYRPSHDRSNSLSPLITPRTPSVNVAGTSVYTTTSVQKSDLARSGAGSSREVEDEPAPPPYAPS